MANLFTVTAASNSVALSEKREGSAAFTVYNASGQPLRGRARLVPLPPTSEQWLSVEGAPERDFPIAGTEPYTVRIKVPLDVAPGSYTFRLDMIWEERPEEGLTEGQVVTFQVPPAPPPKKPFPWWILLVVLGLLVVGGVAAFLLRPRNVEVPLLAGMTVEEAEEELSGAGLELGETETEPSDEMAEGRVISSDPAEGEAVRSGSAVDLIVSGGAGTVEVPDVVDRREADARERLESAGFDVQVETETNPEVEVGRVIRTEPSGGEEAEPGSTVVLVVSALEAPTPTPTTQAVFGGGGAITYRVSVVGQTAIFLQPQTGDPIPLVENKDDARVLDFTSENGGIFAIWVSEGGVENLYLVRPDGTPAGGGSINEGWTTLIDADWSPDGRSLVVEGTVGEQPAYYYFDANGVLLAQPALVP